MEIQEKINKFNTQIQIWTLENSIYKLTLDEFLNYIKYPDCLQTISDIDKQPKSQRIIEKNQEEIKDVIEKNNKGFDSYFETKEGGKITRLTSKRLRIIAEKLGVENTEEQKNTKSFFRHRIVYLCYICKYLLKNTDNQNTDNNEIKSPIASSNLIKEKFNQLKMNNTTLYKFICIMSLFPFDKIACIEKDFLYDFIDKILDDDIDNNTKDEYINELEKQNLINKIQKENILYYSLSFHIKQEANKRLNKLSNNTDYKKCNIIAQCLEYKYNHIDSNLRLTDEALNYAFNAVILYVKSEDYESAWKILKFDPLYGTSLDDRLFVYGRRYGLSKEIILCYKKINNEKLEKLSNSFYYRIVISICYYFKNEFSRGIEELNSLITDINKANDQDNNIKKIYPHALIFLSLCYFYYNETEKAKNTLNELEKYCQNLEKINSRENDNQRQEFYYIKINCYIIKAKISLELENSKDSYNSCQEALKFFKENNVNLPILKAKILSLQARSKCNLTVEDRRELNIKDDDFGEDDLKEAIELFKSNYDPHSETICYVFRMQICIKTKNFQTIETIEKEYNKPERKQYKTPYMNALYYEIKGDLSEDEEERINCYQKAINIAYNTDTGLKFLLPRLNCKLKSVKEPDLKE